jgi:Toprim-like
MLDILSYLPARRKTSSSGWTSFNAPCCVHNGENQDRRSRGGLKLSNEGWSYHCFNCGYTASFVMGRNLTFKARKFLSWLNVPSEEIERINLESLRHKSIAGLLNERQESIQKLQSIEFEDRDLPRETTELTESAEEYLRNRCVPLDYPFLYKTMPRPGIVIPFTHNNQVVGHTTRFLDNKTPRYIQEIPHGYVFGTDLQKDNWQYAVVVEGVFDALSINGLAVLHAEINDAQVRLIRSLGQEVVVVPDQDEAGMKLVDRAVELGWSVSMPEWGNEVKDVNDAVIKYGRLGALLIIMQAREHSKIKIELRKKQIVKRIRN